jgi:hypothetical protein
VIVRVRIDASYPLWRLIQQALVSGQAGLNRFNIRYPSVSSIYRLPFKFPSFSAVAGEMGTGQTESSLSARLLLWFRIFRYDEEAWSD